MSTTDKNKNNCFTIPEDKNKNRFHHVNEIITYVKNPNNPTENFEETMGKYFSYNVDNYRLVWDALKYVLLDQKIITADDELFKSNSKRGRTKGSISISQEAVYCESILELAQKATNNIDYDYMVEKYGRYTTGTSSNAKTGKNKRKSILPSSTPLQKIPDADENAEEEEDYQEYVTTEEGDDEEEQEMQVNQSMNQSLLDVSKQIDQEINNITSSLDLSTLPTFSANSSIPNNMSFNFPPIYGTNLNTQTTNNDSKLDQILQNQTAQFSSLTQTINTHAEANKKILTTLSNEIKKVKSTLQQHTRDIEALQKQIEEKPNEENLKQKLQQIEAANEKSSNIHKNLDTEIKKALDNILPEVTKKLQDDINKNPAIAQRPRANTTTAFRKPTAIWGTGEDSTNEAIPRAYSFVASKIPKQDIYSCDWFKRETQQKLNANKVQAEIISVEHLESTFQTAKTKSFKVIIKGKQNLEFDSLFDPKNWISGTKVTRFRRPRSVSTNNSRNQFTGNTGFGAMDNRHFGDVAVTADGPTENSNSN